MNYTTFEHKSVLGGAIELKEYTLWLMLKSMLPERRTALLEDLLKRLLDHRQCFQGRNIRDVARHLLLLWLGSINDEVVFPLARKHSPYLDEVVYEDWFIIGGRYPTEEVERVISVMQRERATKAKQLYLRVFPESFESGWRDIARQPLEHVIQEGLLREVLLWWRDTQDETEADELFEFFLHVRWENQELGKILTSLIREATNDALPLARLKRHLPLVRNKEGYLRIMGIALVRKSTPEDIEKLLVGEKT